MAAATDTTGWRGGWWWRASRRRSPHHGPRPAGTRIDLVILHSISLPPGEYGGPCIEDLFLGRLDPQAHPYFETLRGLRVSAHFLIRRDGRLLQFVDGDRRAWHAGASSWRGLDNCNDRSIGIELEGLEGQPFEGPQYASLAQLLRALVRRYPLREVVGHEHVAPGRKLDPGPGFDWRRLRRMLRRCPVRLFGEEPAEPGPQAPRRLSGFGLSPTSGSTQARLKARQPPSLTVLAKSRHYAHFFKQEVSLDERVGRV